MQFVEVLEQVRQLDEQARQAEFERKEPEGHELQVEKAVHVEQLDEQIKHVGYPLIV